MARAFLIGAGATKAEYASAPITKDFFALLKGAHSGLFNVIEKNIQRELNEPLVGLNVEDVMLMSEKFEMEVQNILKADLCSAIYELLAESTQSDIGYIRNYLNRKVTRPTSLFRGLLIDERLKSDDFFMTLNYDLCLDRELFSMRGKIDYGLKFQRIQDVDLVSPAPYPEYSVYHLHGALNWEVLDKGLALHLGAIRPQPNRKGADVCIVPPGAKKLNEHLRSIWDIAEQRLLKADELIIIGCSLNPNDRELLDLVHKFEVKQGADKIRIIYYDPNFDPTYDDDTYAKVVGKGHITYPYGLFSDPPTRPSDFPRPIGFIFHGYDQMK